MKILVTGAFGHVGRFVLGEIKDRHEVTALDLNAEEMPGVSSVRADLTDLDETVKTCKGVEAIIHLAAIPHPFVEPQDKILRVNVQTTYNVLEAARLNGIRRVVLASSETATGFGLRRKDMTPEYLPVDEDHPMWPTETYGLSKLLGEKIGLMFHHAFDLEVAAMRYCWVWLPGQEADIAAAIKRARGGEGRPAREFETGTNDFHAYVTPEDVARACRLAAEAEGIGFDPFFICADNTYCSTPTLEIARRYYEPLPSVKDEKYFEDNPNASFFDNRKARRMLGFEPQSDWRPFQ